MARLIRPNKRTSSDGYGRVYVHKFILDDGTILHKVGMCETNRTIDRLMEITKSFLVTYRYIPNIRLRKDKKTLVPRLLEKYMHDLLDEYRYDFDKKFDGYKEFFIDIDEEVLLDYLDNFDDLDLLKGIDSMETKYYDILVKEASRRRDAASSKGEDKLLF